MVALERRVTGGGFVDQRSRVPGATPGGAGARAARRSGAGRDRDRRHAGSPGDPNGWALFSEQCSPPSRGCRWDSASLSGVGGHGVPRSTLDGRGARRRGCKSGAVDAILFPDDPVCRRSADRIAARRLVPGSQRERRCSASPRRSPGAREAGRDRPARRHALVPGAGGSRVLGSVVDGAARRGDRRARAAHGFARRGWMRPGGPSWSRRASTTRRCCATIQLSRGHGDLRAASARARTSCSSIGGFHAELRSAVWPPGVGDRLRRMRAEVGDRRRTSGSGWRATSR